MNMPPMQPVPPIERENIETRSDKERAADYLNLRFKGLNERTKRGIAILVDEIIRMNVPLDQTTAIGAFEWASKTLEEGGTSIYKDAKFAGPSNGGFDERAEQLHYLLSQDENLVGQNYTVSELKAFLQGEGYDASRLSSLQSEYVKAESERLEEGYKKAA